MQLNYQHSYQIIVYFLQGKNIYCVFKYIFCYSNTQFLASTRKSYLFMDLFTEATSPQMKQTKTNHDLPKLLLHHLTINIPLNRLTLGGGPLPGYRSTWSDSFTLECQAFSVRTEVMSTWHI